MNRNIKTLILLIALAITLMFSNVSAEASNSTQDEGWLWPVPDNLAVFSPYTYRASAALINKRDGQHAGIDISKTADLAVVASRSGNVVAVNNSGTKGGNACFVTIKSTYNGETVYVGYWHLKSGSAVHYAGEKKVRKLK